MFHIVSSVNIGFTNNKFTNFFLCLHPKVKKCAAMEFDFCRLVRDAVYDNLDKILSFRDTRRLKPDGSWVTDGDMYVHSLVDSLLCGSRGDVLLVSEEKKPELSGLDNAEYVVTLDPIDGTSNFTYGLAEWGVLVSVYRRMKHWQSMICLPELHRCLITGDGFRRPAGARLAGLPSIVLPDDYASLARDIEYRTMGSCAVNFYYAVTGSYRSIRHYRGAYSWDMLAGLNLALEHGLKAYVDGRPYCGEWLAPGIRHRYLVTE